MQVLTGHIGAVRALGFCADGVHLASAGGRADRLSLWDLRADSRVTRKVPGVGAIYGITCAAQGPALVTRHSGRGALWVDPVADPTATATWTGPHATLRADGAEVVFLDVSAGQPYLQFLSASEGAPTRDPLPIRARDTWSGLAWSPDTNLFAVIGRTAEGHQIEVVHALHGRAIFPPFPLPWSYPLGSAFSADGRVVAGAAGREVRRWDAQTGDPLPWLVDPERDLIGFGFLPDGHVLTCAGATVRLWDGASGRCVRVFDWRIGEVTALTVAADGMRAAVGGKTGTIVVWDLD